MFPSILAKIFPGRIKEREQAMYLIVGLGNPGNRTGLQDTTSGLWFWKNWPLSFKLI